MSIFESLGKLVQESGFAMMMTGDGWKNLVMIIIACVLLYLGIKKQYEPLLMVGIATGCLLANVSALGGFNNALYHQELWDEFLNAESVHHHSYGYIMANGGLIDILYMGVKAGIYPCLIFIGIGAMTDFDPCCSARRRSSACSSPSSAQPCWASMAMRQLPSASSAARTAPQPS